MPLCVAQFSSAASPGAGAQNAWTQFPTRTKVARAIPKDPLHAPPTHRLPYRRNHRVAVPARRAGPHRGHQRLHRAPTAGAPRQAAGECLSRRQDRPHRGAGAGPGDRLLGHAGGTCRQADPRRPERAGHQPAEHRRDLLHAAARGRHGGRLRPGRGVDCRLPRTARRDTRGSGGVAAPAARVLRGVGRADDQRDRVGLGTHRHRRRRGRVPGTRPPEHGPRPHHPRHR